MAEKQVRIKDLPPWRAGYVPGAYVALDSQMQITGKVPLEEFRSWMGGGGGGVDPSELNKKADKVGTGHNNKMAMFDAYGNLADSGINKSGVQTAVSWAHQHGNQDILSQITAPYRTNDAQKLGGIEDGANKYVHPAFDPFGLGLYKFARDNKGHISAYEAVTAADLGAIPGVKITDTTYEAADGIKLDTSDNKNTFKHTNHVSPGQTGTGTATEGPTVEVPYVKYDANGHITEAGTRTHTVTGTLPTSQAADNILSADENNNVSWQQIVAQVFGEAPDAVSLWLSYKGKEFAARRAYGDESGRNIKEAIDDRPTLDAMNTAIELALANYGGFKIVSLTSTEPKVPDVQDPSPRFIYLTKDSQSTKKDKYTEWIWSIPDGSAQGSWEIIGETSVDLSNYIQKLTNATTGNLVKVKADGSIEDAGAKVSDFATAAQGAKADTAVQDVRVNNQTVVGNDRIANINVPVAGDTTPAMDGVASAGSSSAFSREDHVHPHDTSKQNNLPTTGTPTDTYAINITGSAQTAENVHEGTLSIQVGTAAAQTFSANQADNDPVTVNIPMGKRTNGGATTYQEGLIAPADYQKLDNLQVNDGKLKVKLGSAQSASNLFSANQSSDATLEVPLASHVTENSSTTYTEGLMTGEDKEKLDELKNFSKVTVDTDGTPAGEVDLEPSDEKSTLRLKAGSNVVLTADPNTNEVEISAQGGSQAVPVSVSAGRGVSVTEYTDYTGAKDFEVSLDHAIGYLGGDSGAINVSASPTNLIVDPMTIKLDSANDRFLFAEDPNTHQMCVFALKTIPNSDPQLNDGVDGVDLFELTYDVRLERTPSTGFYGFGDISVQRVLSGSSNEGLELHHMSYPAEVGMCSLTGTVTISNNSGKDFTINGKVYHGYMLNYTGDYSTAGDNILLFPRIAVKEYMSGTAEYDSSQSTQYNSGIATTVDANDHNINVNVGKGLETDGNNNLQIKVKAGGGIIIDPTDGVSVVLEGSAQEAVEIAKETQTTIDERIITNMSFSEIHNSYDLGGSNLAWFGNGVFFGTLFTPVMTQEIKGGAKMGFYLRQPGTAGQFALAIYEFDLDSPNNIALVCHTNFHSCSDFAQASQSVSAFRELTIPSGNISETHNKLYSDKLYYTALVCKKDSGGNTPALTGLYGCGGYNMQCNGVPRLTLHRPNLENLTGGSINNLTDATFAQYLGTLSATEGSEDIDTARIFMSIRNIHATT